MTRSMKINPNLQGATNSLFLEPRPVSHLTQFPRMPLRRPPPGHPPPPRRRALRARLPRVMPTTQCLKVRQVVIVAGDDVVHVRGRRRAPRPRVPQGGHALEAIPLQDGQAPDRPVRGEAGAPVAAVPGQDVSSSALAVCLASMPLTAPISTRQLGRLFGSYYRVFNPFNLWWAWQGCSRGCPKCGLSS